MITNFKLYEKIMQSPFFTNTERTSEFQESVYTPKIAIDYPYYRATSIDHLLRCNIPNLKSFLDEILLGKYVQLNNLVNNHTFIGKKRMIVKEYYLNYKKRLLTITAKNGAKYDVLFNDSFRILLKNLEKGPEEKLLDDLYKYNL